MILQVANVGEKRNFIFEHAVGPRAVFCGWTANKHVTARGCGSAGEESRQVPSDSANHSEVSYNITSEEEWRVQWILIWTEAWRMVAGLLIRCPTSSLALSVVCRVDPGRTRAALMKLTNFDLESDHKSWQEPMTPGVSVFMLSLSVYIFCIYTFDYLIQHLSFAPFPCL
jgi:hypothetical protein